MDADTLLCLARETVNAVPTCCAITIADNGDANARLVNTFPVTEDWTVRFMTDRRTRKFTEIARTGRLTLLYYDSAGGASVTMVGGATIIEDVTVKRAVWREPSYRWHPGGPADPNVVLVEFTAERIEMWNTPKGVVPDPTRGLWAAVLTRSLDGWRHTGSTQDAPR